jgi:hypothetical protein
VRARTRLSAPVCPAACLSTNQKTSLPAVAHELEQEVCASCLRLCVRSCACARACVHACDCGVIFLSECMRRVYVPSVASMPSVPARACLWWNTCSMPSSRTPTISHMCSAHKSLFTHVPVNLPSTLSPPAFLPPLFLCCAGTMEANRGDRAKTVHPPRNERLDPFCLTFLHCQVLACVFLVVFCSPTCFGVPFVQFSSRAESTPASFIACAVNKSPSPPLKERDGGRILGIERLHLLNPVPACALPR